MPIPKPSAVPDSSGPGSSSGAAPRQLVRDRVYAQIKAAIIDGVLLPGEKLDEAALRSWLDVSGTPIRQALHRLTLEGLVETAPQSRTTVIAPRPDQALEHLQVIGVLMTGLIVLAFPRIGESDRQDLIGLIDGVLDAIAEGEVSAVTRAAERYHGTVMSLCPNHVLNQVTRQAAASLTYQVNLAYHGLDTSWSQLADDYRALRVAIASSDARGAELATKRIFLLAQD